MCLKCEEINEEYPTKLQKNPLTDVCLGCEKSSGARLTRMQENPTADDCPGYRKKRKAKSSFKVVQSCIPCKKIVKNEILKTGKSTISGKLEGAAAFRFFHGCQN